MRLRIKSVILELGNHQPDLYGGVLMDGLSAVKDNTSPALKALK